MIVDPTRLHPIPNSENQTCFACGPRNLHGLHMTFSSDGEQVFSFLQVPPAMTGWDRTVHGGVLATMLDEIMAWSVIYLLKKFGVTQTITIDYHKAVNAEEHLTIVGGVQETHSERSVQMVGSIYNADDTLCAQATGCFTMMQPKAAVRLGLVGEDYMKIFEPILRLSPDRRP